MAFHPYPQVIPALCNGHGFGPPRACSARFTLPMGSSPGFGSYKRDWSPFRTRFPSGSGCCCLNLATPTYSSAHSTKGTPSLMGHPTSSDRLEAHGFRICFTPLAGVLFTIPSRYWFTIGRWSYLALGGGPPSFPPNVTCWAVLTSRDHRGWVVVNYGTLTRSGAPFQHASSGAQLCRRRSVDSVHPKRPTPSWQRSTAHNARVVWALPRSLAATEGILSFPRGTEMFQFPRFPPWLSRVTGHHARRVAPFGDLWITGCQRLPRAFRRVATSFIGVQRQGIHRVPIIPVRPFMPSFWPFSPARLVPRRDHEFEPASPIVPRRNDGDAPSSSAGHAWMTLLVFPARPAGWSRRPCCDRPFGCQGAWQWSRGGSNPEPPPCKGGALPVELRPRPRWPVGAPGLEPGTSALSGPRSNQLSYAPAAFPCLVASPTAEDGGACSSPHPRANERGKRGGVRRAHRRSVDSNARSGRFLRRPGATAQRCQPLAQAKDERCVARCP